jgi:transposase-like protein
MPHNLRKEIVSMSTAIFDRNTGLALAKACADSGLSIAGFARQRQIAQHIVIYWVRLYRKLEASKTTTPTPLVEITTSTQETRSSLPKPAPLICIRLRNGVLIELPHSSHTDAIIRMVAQL